MLASLFGELGSIRGPSRRVRAAPTGRDADFAATAILESVAAEVNDRGQIVDRHQHDLVVTGSPAQAIRGHFATTRADLETASRLITLLDPMAVWAPLVIKALSDAGGQPIERLHLRQHTTLRTLATIERTTLIRRHDETLKVYHADVLAPGRENAEIPVALMERSHMTVVIVGPLEPHDIDGVLAALRDATSLPTWRCPQLVFMVPPGAVWIDTKINAVDWPKQLHVHVLNEPLTSASAVWNALLGIWSQVKTQSALDEARERPVRSAEHSPRPSQVEPSAHAVIAPLPATRPALRSRPLDPTQARSVLADMLAVDGVLGCAVVDSTTSLILAREIRNDPQVADLDLSAAVSGQLMRAHRQAARSMGVPGMVDEVMSSAGPRQLLLRTVSSHPELFLMALLDKHRANLALTRFKLMEVERNLA